MDFTTLRNLGIDVREQANLSEFTTFRLGGKCSLALSCSTPKQLDAALKFLQQNRMEFVVIGGGSNVLVSDEGIHQAVVRYVAAAPLIERDGYELHVAASTKLDELVLYAAQQGLLGLNFASGVPGTVGGAIVGNAGAFGKQIGDAVKSVTVITRDGVERELSNEELHFSYRDSILKRTGEIVVKAKFVMTPANTVEILKERQEIITSRWEKHPDIRTTPSAGSFFRNIEPTSRAGRRQAAGWFLDQVGAKTFSCGGAAVFEKHANIIIRKSEACTAQDVFILSQKMADAVKQYHGIDLVREVRLVGRFSGVPDDSRQVMW